MPPATVLVGADVRTMVSNDARADAVAWRGEHLLAVGAREDVLRAAGDDAVVRDVGGAAVLPGFIDAHHHACLVALYGALVRLSAPTVRDIPSLQRAVADAARALPPGAWLVCLDWDESQLTERRPPNADELDEAAPHNPVLALHYSCHRAVANRRALALAGLNGSSAAPPGGDLGRDRRGRLDGLLIERAMSPAERLARADLLARDAAAVCARLAAHHDAMLAAGITRVVDTAVPGDLVSLYREAQRQGALRVPTVIFPTGTSGYLDAPWEALDGAPTGHREGNLEVGAVKLVLDGAPVCHMCLRIGQSLGALLRAWQMAARDRSLDPIRTALSVRPRLGRDGLLRSGLAIYTPTEAQEMVAGAVARGFAVASHAIGNAAIETALDAYAAAGAPLHRAARPRIEHASFPTKAQVARIAGEGIAVVAQPGFVALPAVRAAPAIPGLPYLPLRALLDAGVLVAGSSDHPVAGFDPLDGVRAAVFRRNADGRVTEPDERVSLDEALALYTRAAAEVSGCADRCGTLAPGLRADLVVLSGPLRRAADLDGIRVAETILGGEATAR
jgi:predicted amidohydrolase YtcJ